MTHETEIVETKELNDEHVAYLIRCCGDPTTDSWHTMSVLVPTKDDSLTHEQHLDDRKAEVATRHEAKVAWRKKMDGQGLTRSK